VIIGSSFIVCGLIGAGLNSLVMNRCRRFKLVLLIGLIGTTASYFFSFLVIKVQNSVLSIVFPGLMGFFEIPLRAHGIAFMCEVAYPVSRLLGKRHR
jgi:hypothetical protein